MARSQGKTVFSFVRNAKLQQNIFLIAIIMLPPFFGTKMFKSSSDPHQSCYSHKNKELGTKEEHLNKKELHTEV